MRADPDLIQSSQTLASTCITADVGKDLFPVPLNFCPSGQVDLET